MLLLNDVHLHLTFHFYHNAALVYDDDRRLQYLMVVHCLPFFSIGCAEP